ncbi:hypothetical protein [Streptosporangium amethystogenes]|uniref:hypothetical protein n=1 Tax=Streptosporangium amethystogenes TaxID=2002 RepID=UPI0012F80E32|nr:hypothetical protein [Streptosporangium amethystogenes]
MAVRTPVRRGPDRRFLSLSAAVAGAAAAATVALTLFVGAGTPAYAVDKGADGSVEVRINEFRDPGELQAELAGAGVRAVVDYLPAGQTCRPSRGEPAGAGGQMQVGIGKEGKGIAFKIEKGQVGADQTLVLAITVDQAGADRPPMATSLQVVKGTVAPCEATPLPLPTDSSTGENKGEEGPGHHTESGGKDGGPSLNTSTG